MFVDALALLVATAFALAGIVATTVGLQWHGQTVAVAFGAAVVLIVGLGLGWARWRDTQAPDRPRSWRIRSASFRCAAVGLAGVLIPFVILGRHTRAATTTTLAAFGLLDAPSPKVRTLPLGEMMPYREPIISPARVRDAARRVERAMTFVAEHSPRIRTEDVLDLEGIVIRRWDSLRVTATGIFKKDPAGGRLVHLDVRCQQGDRLPVDRDFAGFHGDASTWKDRQTWELFVGRPELTGYPCELRWSADDEPLASVCLTEEGAVEGACPAPVAARDVSEVFGVDVDPGRADMVDVDFFVRLDESVPRGKLEVTGVCTDGDLVAVDTHRSVHTNPRHEDRRTNAFLFHGVAALAAPPRSCFFRFELRPALGDRVVPLGDFCTGEAAGDSCERPTARRVPSDSSLELLDFTEPPDHGRYVDIAAKVTRGNEAGHLRVEARCETRGLGVRGLEVRNGDVGALRPGETLVLDQRLLLRLASDGPPVDRCELSLALIDGAQARTLQAVCAGKGEVSDGPCPGMLPKG
ncbi:MAG: hypothetical protein AAF721_04545 [Myxococcota bacterium]